MGTKQTPRAFSSFGGLSPAVSVYFLGFTLFGRSLTSVHNLHSHQAAILYLTFRAATVLCSSASITLETENLTVPRESLTKGILPSFCHARIVRTETLSSDANVSAVISCGCSFVSFIV